MAYVTGVGAEGIQTDGHRGLTASGRRRPVEGRLPCGYGLKRQVRDMSVDAFADDLAHAWVGSYRCRGRVGPPRA
jgi:hypothetical protein